MPRHSRAFTRFDTSQYQPTEGEILQPGMGLELKGMDSDLPVNMLDPGVARRVRNLTIRNGAYETRDGTSVIGTASTADLIHALDVGLTTGLFKMTRFHLIGVDVYNSGAWAAATNTGGFVGGITSPFAFSAWGDTLMFRAGSGKIYVLTYGPPDVVTEIAGAPSGAIHLSTFGTRAIATLASNRVQWSVRANNLDWAGIGSGYEDLRSSPGGRPDQAVAVVPISDETAFMVRTNSIWQITLTGNFDAPFAFNRLYEFIGGRYSELCTAITRGLICVNDHQIWMVTAQGIKDISLPIRSMLVAAQPYLNSASATYDPIWREYRLVLPGLVDTDQRIMRYSIENDAWSEDTYDFPARSIAYTLFTTVGPSTSRPGMVYAMGNLGQLVVRDDFTRNNAALRDVNGAGAARPGGFRIETGDLRRSGNTSRKDLVEVVVWYEAQSAFILYFEYSIDGGSTWTFYSSLSVGTTTRPTPISLMVNIDRPYIQIACYTDVTPTVRLIKIEPMLREAGKITDAY